MMNCRNERLIMFVLWVPGIGRKAALGAFCALPHIAFGQSRSSFLASAPNHHITPKRDNISLSLEMEMLDLTVGPALDQLPKDLSELDQRLEMTGWSVLPLIAFSADRFGIGFTGEAGKRQIKYLDREPESDTSAGTFLEQFSETRYTGVGIYGFVSLRSSSLPNWLGGTLIIGGRSLTAVNETRGTRTDSTTDSPTTRLKYDVRAYDFGLNVAATLAKRFTVFPWINHRQVQPGSIKDGNEKVAASLGDSVSVPVEMDRQLIWQSAPTLTYGIDFAVRIQRFEVHLGGLFGYLANLNRGADRVQDQGLSLSVGYDLKSR
jgi:hypothetical protein